MPSRDIKDCTEMLQLAWMHSSKTYAERYPQGPHVFLTCTHRTNDEQRKLYAQGRTTPGPIVTQIRENGKHNIYPAHAFDIAFQKDGKLDWSSKHFKNFAAIVAERFKSVKWGGNWTTFKDLPHFEV